MAVVSLESIIKFFEDERKLIGRGENAYRSGRVEDFTYDGTSGVLRGRIKSSLKDVQYSVEVSYCSFFILKWRLAVHLNPGREFLLWGPLLPWILAVNIFWTSIAKQYFAPTPTPAQRGRD